MLKTLIIILLNQTPTYTIPPIEVSAKYPENFLSAKGTSYYVDSLLLSTFKFDPALTNFSFTPSININSYGYPGHLHTALLRGLSSSKTGVYIEGFKLNSRSSGTVNLSYISLLPLSRIEILSSSGSSIYGESALSGALNFKLERKSGFNLKGGGSNLRTTIFSGTASFPFSHFYYSNYTSIPPEKNKDAHLSQFVNIFENENLKSILFYSKNNIGNITSETTREDDEIVLTGIRYRNENLNIGYQYKKEDIDIVSEIFPSKTSNVSNRFFGDLFLNLEALRLRGGFEYEREYLKGTVFGDTVKPEDERLYPYFSLDLILKKIIPYFEGGKELKGAFKTKSPFVYRTGLLIFNENASFYFNYSKGFKAPNLFDLYYPFDGFAKGNPDLKPENSSEIEGGLKVFEKKSYLLLSYFQRELKEGIIWAPDTSFVWTPQNLEKIKTSGFEGIINFSSEKILINLNFIIYRERKKEEQDTIKNLLLIPTYNFSFLLGQNLKNLSYYYRIRIIGPHLSPDPYTFTQKEVKSIVFHDISFNFRLNMYLTLSLIVTNLDNKPYEYQIGYPLERRRIYVFAEANI